MNVKNMSAEFEIPKHFQHLAPDELEKFLNRKLEKMSPDELLEKMGNLELNEVQEVQIGEKGLGKETSEEMAYFSVEGVSPKELKNLSPFQRKEGPILSSVPDFVDMQKMVDKGTIECLLLNCMKEVNVSKVQLSQMTPYEFLCFEHKLEVEERYGYGKKVKKV